MSDVSTRVRLRLMLLGVTVSLMLPVSTAGAQGRRTAMVDSARALIDDFNERQSIALLRRALDPALGAPDGSWSRGVQLLGQTLLQTNQREEALSWLRWALRQSPSLQVDSVNFTPALVSAFYEARAFVQASRAEPRVSVRFQWATATTSGGFGDLLVERGEAAGETPLQLSVNGEFLAEKQARRLSPGTYRIAARAVGQTDADFTTEVLPGVTTTVTLNLAPAARVVSAVTDAAGVSSAGPSAVAPPVDAGVAPVAKKGRKTLWFILGGAGVAGLGAAVAMQKGSEPPVGPPVSTTGSIIIALP
jgi:hypothetical protein